MPPPRTDLEVVRDRDRSEAEGPFVAAAMAAPSPPMAPAVESGPRSETACAPRTARATSPTRSFRIVVRLDDQARVLDRVDDERYAQSFTVGFSLNDGIGDPLPMAVRFLPRDPWRTLGGPMFWDYEVRIPACAILDHEAAHPEELVLLAGGSLFFDDSGEPLDDGEIPVPLPALANGAPSRTVFWKLRDPIGGALVTCGPGSSRMRGVVLA